MARGSRRRIEGHHDFAVLETRLAGLLRAAGAAAPEPAGSVVSLAIVAPTRRLIDHLRIVLATRFPALLGVHFFHHQALARAAAEAAGRTLPRIAPDRLLEAVLARVLAAAGGDLAAYVTARPGALRSILASLLDLREAGFSADSIDRTSGLSDRGRALLRIHAPFARALETLRRDGIADRAGVLASARDHIASFADRFRLVVHYGAYDLTGAALLLMREVEAGAERVVYLTPHHPDSPAYACARRFWPAAFGEAPEPIDPGPADDDARRPGTGAADPGARLCGRLLPLLYQEDARPDRPLEIAAFHAQGGAAELGEVALRILALHRNSGIRLRDVAVIARSLDPYAADLEPVFAAHSLPFTTSAALPAVREIRVQAAIRLARAAGGDYDRRPLMDLACSGLLRIEGRPVGAEAHSWDLLSRAFRVTGGFETWTKDLPSWVDAWRPHLPADDPEASGRAAALKEARRRQAGELAGAVRRIDRVVRPARRAAGWRVWADRFEEALGLLVDGFGEAGGSGGPAGRDRGAAAVRSVLDVLRDFETAGVPFTNAEAWSAFETALAELSMPIGAPGGDPGSSADDNGGVRVLDTMQARGLSFRAVFLIGLNADLFPRRATEDPFLGDADRQALEGSIAVPLPLSSTALEEEHLLLAHMIDSARDHLVVSWQRADESGRARVPSLAIREIARIGRGEPVLERFLQDARRVPGHPGEAADDACRTHGLLPALESLTGAAIACADASRFAAHLDELPPPGQESSLRAGLGLLHTIENGDGRDLRFDACPGPGVAGPEAAVWSPSRLEIFGQCPQRHFFARVLRVGEIDAVARAWEIDAADLGGRIHEVLRVIYEAIRDAGDFEDPERGAEAAAHRARALLPAAWSSATADLEARLHHRYPAWWEALSATWCAALERFLDGDTAALGRDAARFLGLEQEVRADLDLGDGKILAIRGRIDRAVAVADRGEAGGRAGVAGRVRIGDYKTSKNIAAYASVTTALKGRTLQIPLYILMTEANSAVWGVARAPVDAEILGVGPWFSASALAVPRAVETRAALDAGKLAPNRAGLLETLRVLGDLAATGSFPLNPDDSWCGRCPYRRACRRDHPATLERVQSVEAFADFFDLDGKSSRAPTLAAVRARAGGEEDA